MAGCFLLGRAIPIGEQMPVFEALRETASIIFAVMGIWIAVLFPFALEKLFKRAQASDADLKTAQRLLRPMLYSTIVIALVLLIEIAQPILKTLSIPATAHPWIRGFSFSVLGGLAYLQLSSILFSLVPQNLLDKSISTQQQRQRTLKRFVRENAPAEIEH